MKQEIEEENKKKIIEIVNKYFYLTDKSKEDFAYFLQNQEHADAYKLVAEQEDKRLFFDFPQENQEAFDESWKNFERNFDWFIRKHNLNYKNYIDNKTNENVKLSKAMFDDLAVKNKDCLDIIFRRFLTSRGIYNGKLLKAIIVDKDTEGYCVNKVYFDDNLKIVFYCDKPNGKKTYLRKVIHQKTWKDALKTIGLQSIITSILNSNYLGNRVKKNDNLKVCFSLNYADWFLCSTNNSWSSCLSMENSLGYWAGLAGLVCDRNRIMIFVTDMKEKEYMGVKSYNMIKRLWAFTCMDTAGKGDCILCNGVYPNKEKCFDLTIFNVFPKEYNIFYSKYDKDCTLIGKYFMPIIWHEGKKGKKFASSVYEDSFEKHFTNDKNFIYYKTGEYGLTCLTLNEKKDIYGTSKYDVEELSFDVNGYCVKMREVA